MPRFIIHHITRYRYAQPVTDSANQIMLYPVNDAFQQVIRQELDVTGQPAMERFVDYYGNDVGTFMLAQPHRELCISVRHTILTHPRPIPDVQWPIAQQWDELAKWSTQAAFLDFLKTEPITNDQLRDVLLNPMRHQIGVWQAVEALNHYVYTQFKYIKGVTHVESTLEEIWRLQAGVCQDFAHVLLALLRQLGIPARYVSGYVCPHDHQLRGEGATHAWVEAYVPSIGWIGVDPTNNCLASELHVKLAVGRNFADCSPVRGTYKGTREHTLEVGVSVVHEDGWVAEETATLLTEQPAPVVPVDPAMNSYLRHMQQMQQQQ